MNERRRRKGLLAGALGLGLWILLPLMAGGYLLVQSQREELEPTRLTWASVQASGGTLSTNIGIALDWVPTKSLVAPGWSGTVQSFVQPGVEVVTGTEVALVDGVRRNAWATTLPFSAPLGIGSRGVEVEQLNNTLRTLGFAAPEGDSFTTDTRKAVRAYASSIGVAGASEVESFDPSWVVFLPEPTTVGQTAMVAGAPAPAPGTEIVMGSEVVDSGTFVVSGQVDVILGLEEFEGSVDDVIPDTARIVLSVEDDVDINGTEILAAEGGSLVAPESLTALSSRVASGTRAVSASRTFLVPEDSWEVPAAAVFVTSDGASCMLVRDSEDSRSSGQLIPVTVVASTLTGSVVTGAIADNQEVALFASRNDSKCE